MKFYLVFENSNDSIPFVAENSDLLEYYLSFINSEKINNFLPDLNLKNQIEKELQNIKSVISDYNKHTASSFTGKMPDADKLEDFLDQELLNLIHFKWVHSNHVEYTFSKIKKLNIDNKHQWLLDQLPDDDHVIPASEILYKFNVKNLHDTINKAVHNVEALFDNIKYKGDFDQNWEWKEIKNIFPKNYTSNNTANLRISFHHYGRTLYDKFKNQSGTVFHDDENTYNQLLGFLNLSLKPAETILFSKEYLEWCKQIGRDPGGDMLNLGRIQNLSDHLTEYRKIVYNNTLAQNRFQIVI